MFALHGFVNTGEGHCSDLYKLQVRHSVLKKKKATYATEEKLRSDQLTKEEKERKKSAHLTKKVAARVDTYKKSVTLLKGRASVIHKRLREEELSKKEGVKKLEHAKQSMERLSESVKKCLGVVTEVSQPIPTTVLRDGSIRMNLVDKMAEEFGIFSISSRFDEYGRMETKISDIVQLSTVQVAEKERIEESRVNEEKASSSKTNEQSTLDGEETVVDQCALEDENVESGVDSAMKQQCIEEKELDNLIEMTDKECVELEKEMESLGREEERIASDEQVVQASIGGSEMNIENKRKKREQVERESRQHMEKVKLEFEQHKNDLDARITEMKGIDEEKNSKYALCVEKVRLYKEGRALKENVLVKEEEERGVKMEMERLEEKMKELEGRMDQKKLSATSDGDRVMGELCEKREKLTNGRQKVNEKERTNVVLEEKMVAIKGRVTKEEIVFKEREQQLLSTVEIREKELVALRASNEYRETRNAEEIEKRRQDERVREREMERLREEKRNQRLVEEKKKKDEEQKMRKEEAKRKRQEEKKRKNEEEMMRRREEEMRKLREEEMQRKRREEEQRVREEETRRKMEEAEIHRKREIHKKKAKEEEIQKKKAREEEIQKMKEQEAAIRRMQEEKQEQRKQKEVKKQQMEEIMQMREEESRRMKEPVTPINTHPHVISLQPRKRTSQNGPSAAAKTNVKPRRRLNSDSTICTDDGADDFDMEFFGSQATPLSVIAPVPKAFEDSVSRRPTRNEKRVSYHAMDGNTSDSTTPPASSCGDLSFDIGNAVTSTPIAQKPIRKSSSGRGRGGRTGGKGKGRGKKA